MQAMREELGTVFMVKKLGLIENPIQKNVLIVKKVIKLIFLQDLNIVLVVVNLCIDTKKIKNLSGVSTFVSTWPFV